MELNNPFWLDRPTFVTGGTGLVGSWLIQRLIDAGADVVCLVRDWVPQSEAVRRGNLERVKVVRGDVRDRANRFAATQTGSRRTIGGGSHDAQRSLRDGRGAVNPRFHGCLQCVIAKRQRAHEIETLLGVLIDSRFVRRRAAWRFPRWLGCFRRGV